jgi:molecular chaperone Hsp33
MTDDGGFRVMTARTTDTAQGVIDTQSATGDIARWLSDLVTGTTLVRETMAPNYRVQGIIHGVGRSGALVADSHPDGGARGLVQRRGGTDPIVASGAVLELMRTLPRGNVQKGMVSVPESGGLSAAFMAYLQESEQVVSMIAMSAVFEGKRVRAAGGYLVQVLPELSEPMLAIMTERLTDLPSIDSMLRDEATTPETLMAELLYGFPYTLLADSEVSYKCRCDAVRLMASLATLPREEVVEMVREGKTLEIQCDYCQTEYRIDPEKLRGLLTQS